MSGRPVTHLSSDQSRRSARAAIARAHLFGVDADAPKRIDHYIDYFGSGGGRRSIVPSDPSRASLLDGNGAR